MTRKMLFIGSVLILSLILAVPAFARGEGNPHAPGKIYVTGQGLVYDTFATADPLPMKGRFQLLEEGGPTGAQTEYGPGDQGFVGGRWWVDDGDVPGVMESTDHFFLCPLLGPGSPP
jgi:hypothetical protein